MKATPSQFPKWLLKVLDACSFSRKEWAQILEVSQGAFSQWTTDRILPRAPKLIKLVKEVRSELGEDHILLNEFRGFFELSGREVTPKAAKYERFADYILGVHKEQFMRRLSSFSSTEQLDLIHHFHLELDQWELRDHEVKPTLDLDNLKNKLSLLRSRIIDCVIYGQEIELSEGSQEFKELKALSNSFSECLILEYPTILDHHTRDDIKDLILLDLTVMLTNARDQIKAHQDDHCPPSHMLYIATHTVTHRSVLRAMSVKRSDAQMILLHPKERERQLISTGASIMQKYSEIHRGVMNSPLEFNLYHDHDIIFEDHNSLGILLGIIGIESGEHHIEDRVEIEAAKDIAKHEYNSFYAHMLTASNYMQDRFQGLSESQHRSGVQLMNTMSLWRQLIHSDDSPAQLFSCSLESHPQWVPLSDQIFKVKSSYEVLDVVRRQSTSQSRLRWLIPNEYKEINDGHGSKVILGAAEAIICAADEDKDDYTPE